MRAQTSVALIVTCVICVFRLAETLDLEAVCTDDKLLQYSEVVELCEYIQGQAEPEREKRFLRFGRALAGDLFLRFGRKLPSPLTYGFQDKRFLRFGRNDAEIRKLIAKALERLREYDNGSLRKKRSAETDQDESKPKPNNTEQSDVENFGDFEDDDKVEFTHKQKRFMRFGRGGRLSDDTGDMDKRFMRFGRDPSKRFMRFGRSSNDKRFMRFGRDATKRFMRFGRDSSDLDLSKRFMRFGRSGGMADATFDSDDVEKRFMRFGRAPGVEKRFMRFGRAPGVEKRFMRFGRAPGVDKRFMRFGRAPGVDKRFMRFGRNMDAEKRFMRFGRTPDISSYDKPLSQSSYPEKRFMRFGRSVDNQLS